MKLKKNIAGYVFNRYTLILLFLAACADVYLETVGLPPWMLRHLTPLFTTPDVSFTIQRINAGVWYGIVCRDVEGFIDTDAGTLRLHTSSAALRLKPLHLLYGKPCLQQLNLDTTHLMLYDGGGEVLQRLTLYHCSYSSDQLGEGRFLGSAQVNGIEIDMDVACHNVNAVWDFVRSLELNPVVKRNEELCTGIEKTAQFFKGFDFRSGYTKLELYGSLDFQDLSSAYILGKFRFNDVLLPSGDSVGIRGNFRCDCTTIASKDIVIRLGERENIRLSATFNLQSQALTGVFQGALTPRTALSLAAPPDVLSSPLSSQEALIQFKGDFSSGSLDLSSFRGNAQLEVANYDVYAFRIAKALFKLRLEKSVVNLDSLEVSHGRNTIYGKGSFDLTTQSLEMQLNARLSLNGFGRFFGIELSDTIRENLNDPVNISCSLLPSPLDWKKWHALMKVDTTRLLDGNWRLSTVNAQFELKNAVLSLNKAQGILDRNRDNSIVLGASLDLAFLENKVGEVCLSIPHTLKLNGKRKEDTQCACIDWQGTAMFKPNTPSIFLEGKGTAFPDTLYTAYLEQSGIPDVEYFAPYYCGDTPARFQARLPWIKLSGSDWSLSGSLDGDNMGFGDFKTVHCSSDFTLDAKHFEFTNLKGVLPEGGHCSMNLRYVFTPTLFELTDLKAKSDISQIHSFIFNREGSEVFRSIWKDMTWGEGELPEYEISRMAYSSDWSGAEWQLILDGHISAKNARYTTLPTRSISCGVKLALPDDMEISPIEILFDKGSAKGRCTMNFTGTPSCNVILEELQGDIDFNAVCNTISPNLGSELSHLYLAPDTKLKGRANFFISGPPMLSMDGQIEAPALKIYNWSVKDLKGDWFVEDNLLRWDVKHSNFMEGDLKTTGCYNFRNKAGNVLLISKDMSWDLLTKEAKVFQDNAQSAANAVKESKDAAYDANAPKTPPSKTEKAASQKDKDNKDAPGKPAATTPGAFDLLCNLSFRKNWAGRPWHIDGDGQFHLRNADLWHVPLMQQLNKLLDITTFRWNSQKKSSFGTITEVKADLDFKGAKVVIPNLATNGTIIALEGNGEYSWEKDRLFFTVSGEALKEISLVSTILKPLTWAFHAELSGTKTNAKWKTKSNVKRLFISD